MPTKHINAHDAFPPELVKEIQKYYSEGYSWIPRPDGEDINSREDDK